MGNGQFEHGSIKTFSKSQIIAAKYASQPMLAHELEVGFEFQGRNARLVPKWAEFRDRTTSVRAPRPSEQRKSFQT